MRRGIALPNETDPPSTMPPETFISSLSPSALYCGGRVIKAEEGPEALSIRQALRAWSWGNLQSGFLLRTKQVPFHSFRQSVVWYSHPHTQCQTSARPEILGTDSEIRWLPVVWLNRKRMKCMTVCKRMWDLDE